jgi:hypothetical protein
MERNPAFKRTSGLDKSVPGFLIKNRTSCQTMTTMFKIIDIKIPIMMINDVRSCRTKPL